MGLTLSSVDTATLSNGHLAGPAPESSLPIHKLLWEAWSGYAKRAGGYEAAFLFSIVYVVVLGPTWAISRLTRHPFLDLDPKAPPRWHERASARSSLADMEHPF